MDYKIVSEESSYSLESRVKDLIKQGWIPQGGFYRSSVGGTCYQAMIKQ